jgi:hypothetical protein
MTVKRFLMCWALMTGTLPTALMKPLYMFGKKKLIIKIPLKTFILIWVDTPLKGNKYVW